MLLDKQASPHATAKNGHTPLHIAAKKNQVIYYVVYIVIKYKKVCNFNLVIIVEIILELTN